MPSSEDKQINYSPTSLLIMLMDRGKIPSFPLLRISSGVFLQLSRNTLYLLSPRLCFFILLNRDLFVNCGESLTSFTTLEAEGEVGPVTPS